ncbi:MAG: proton-conducting transporter membrane subunit [Gemmatimonadales bacterium]
MRLLAWGVGLILSGGAAALIFRRKGHVADALFRLLVPLGCILAAVPAVAALVSPPLPMWTSASSLPGGPWVLGLDPLSAWFLLLITLASGATAVYGVTYLGGEREHRSPAPAHAGFAVLVASMIGVVLAQAAVPFLMTWELMAVSAYFLIVHESERRAVTRAGLVYLVLTHVGTLALFVMFLAWRGHGADLTFRSLALASAALPLGGAAVLLLSLVGFGVKAGVVPLHFWLPGAHAAAPSHVSALLSGVMLKMGIYGLLRVMSLLGVVPAWWGWTLLGLGLLSGVLGVLWALGQHDIKRVLAYSSVENIGIILLGMGIGALGWAHHQPVVAVLGFTGAVLHTLNHALFKSLLFLGAGAVVRATGTRAIDELGGVARRMPWTAAAFLVGSMAIVGLPPLNGFVSEWIVLQALLRGGIAAGPTRFVVFAAAGLALIAALAVACFTRVLGVVFLGQSRAGQVGRGAEAGPGMLLPMFALGTGCCVLGVAPTFVIEPALRVAGQVLRLSPENAAAADPGLSPAALGIGGLALALAAAAGAVSALRLMLGRGRSPARATTWGCGYPRPSERMQYTASSFGAPLLAAFSVAEPPVRRTESSFATDPEDRVLLRLVGPVWDRVRTAAATLRPLQQGRVTTYLQYIVFTLIVLLVVLFASVGRRP